MEQGANFGTDKRPVRTRPAIEDIDEVFDRIYASGAEAAGCLETVTKNGITHIVRVTQVATPQHPNIKYQIFANVWDDSE